MHSKGALVCLNDWKDELVVTVTTDHRPAQPPSVTSSGRVSPIASHSGIAAREQPTTLRVAGSPAPSDHTEVARKRTSWRWIRSSVASSGTDATLNRSFQARAGIGRLIATTSPSMVP